MVATFVASAAAGAADRGAEKRRPIVDTHIHLYKVTRPQGVPFPSPKNQILYRDVLPSHYESVARPLGVIACGIVEASDRNSDNQFVLDLVKGNRFFPFLVAQLDLGAADFPKQLADLARDPRVVGIRGFLWGPTMTLDAVQLANLRELARRGMTLDLITRGSLNPKDKVSELARAVPTLRIILDHLAGASGDKPTPAWELDLRRLADLHPNIFIKFSSFYDMYNPGPGEDRKWKAPTDLAAYQPHFDVLMSAFGPDRLIWASNWPVSEMGGDFAKQIDLAEQFLAPLGTRVRDKVMYKNALSFYRRVPPAR